MRDQDSRCFPLSLKMHRSVVHKVFNMRRFNNVFFYIFRDLKMENILLDEKWKNLKVIGKF